MWQEPDSYPSEPLFVQTPDGVDEDDGRDAIFELFHIYHKRETDFRSMWVVQVSF